MTSIFLKDSFDSAHWLPNVPAEHKCRRMHGHTYRVTIHMIGPIGITTGWVIDYADLKADWIRVKAILDHQILNEIPGLENPTCEIIAHYIGDSMETKPSKIELSETEHCGAIWER